MSTVLTKPVLLDETGQAIVGKLQDIQQAIGGTGEFIPINIRVTTPPTKTNYLAGETLDLSGMVVTLVANNGGMYDVTGDCVFSPADGSVVTSSTTEVNISYTWYKDSTVFTAVQPISIKELASIAVTTPPTVTEYNAGDTLDLTGIVVTATFEDGTTSIVTNGCVFTPADGDTLAVSDTTINISLTMGAVTKTTTQAISVTAIIYGVEWSGTSSSAWARTDAAADFVNPVPYYSGMSATPSSPFDDIYPWSQVKPIESSLSGFDPDAGFLIQIPKFYYKWTKNGSAMKLQISEFEFEGSHISPAHMDRGDGQGERNIVYVGSSHCCDNYKSDTSKPTVSKSPQKFIDNISLLGDDIWMWDWTMYWTIVMLYLVEYADWNVQSKIGFGGGYGGSSPAFQLRPTDFPYHTGTYESSINTPGHVVYRYITDLWANVTDFVGGLYYTGNKIYFIKNPADFNQNVSGGILIGEYTPASSNPSNLIISEWNVPEIDGCEFLLYPKSFVSNSTYNTYTCDMSTFSNTTSYTYVAKVGGEYGQSTYNDTGRKTGLFRIDVFAAFSTGQSGSAGARLMKLPNNT